MLTTQTDAAAGLPRSHAHPDSESGDNEIEADSGFVLRAPKATDGAAVAALIAASPPLDRNSTYCNLIQCSHFADTCLVAERNGVIEGWVSGHRVPADPSLFFVWQIAVAETARGHGLARRMIEALIARPAVQGASALITTITDDNRASWALFESLARKWDASLERSAMFDREIHFNGAHDSEWQARISPLPHHAAPQTTQEL